MLKIKTFFNVFLLFLVNFFASWCKPCRDEHIFIENFSEKKGVRVIGVNYKDNSDKAIAWLNKFGNPYSNIILENTSAGY